MLTDEDGKIRNVMSPLEVCEAMKLSNYFSYLDTQEYPKKEMPLAAIYKEGSPIKKDDKNLQNQPFMY